MTRGGFSIPYSGTLNTSSSVLRLENTSNGRGVYIRTFSGTGLAAFSQWGIGVYGESVDNYGVYGFSWDSYGVIAQSSKHFGLFAASGESWSAYMSGKAIVTSNLAIGSVPLSNVGAALHIKSSNSNWGQHIRLENYQDSGYAEILHDNDGLKFRNFQAGEGFYFRNSTNNTMARIDEEGNLTVKSNKGIVRSETGSQLKYYSRKITYGATLGAFSTFIGDVIPIATFSGPPQVYIANVEDQSGDYYKVVISPVAVTNDSVRFRFYNASDTPSTFTGTWNIVAVGPE